MENQELMRYLKDAIEQETSIVEQENTIAEYNRLSLLRKPEKRVEGYPQKPGTKVFEISGIMAGIIGCLCAALFFIGFGSAYWDNEDHLEELRGYYQQAQNSGRGRITVETRYGYKDTMYADDLLAEIKEEEGDRRVGNILRGIGFICLAGAVGLGYYIYRRKTETANENASALEAYQRACRKVEQNNARSAAAYDTNLSDWNRSNKEMQAYMAKPLSESRALLDRYYASEIIYPKYRTLPALTSIYEYFMTGRCTELTGPHGAYNLYEDELRKDTVISQLNTVIENLEQIRHNQYMLYQQVKAIQENTATIASELQQIKGYTVQIAQLTALNAYYAALNERNTRITMYHHL